MVAWLPHSDGDYIPPDSPYHLFCYSHPDYGDLAPNLSCFSLLVELLALQINSSRDWGSLVAAFFGSALQDCHYSSGSCPSHCWWLTLHLALQKEILCMVSRRSFFWIPFSALPLGQQFYHDSCKYWHLPGTCLCTLIPHWNGLTFFFWICLDFFLALFFYPAFLWRAHKKENPFSKALKIFFFLETLTPCTDILGTFHCSLAA